MMLRSLSVSLALLLQPLVACAQLPRFEDRVGDAYEIHMLSTSETSGEDGSSSSDGATFVAKAAIDPAVIRRERAEADAILATMMGDRASSLTAVLEAQVASRANEQISGTVETTFRTDAAGRVTDRTRLIQLEIIGGSRGSEKQAITERTTWRPVSLTKENH